MIETCRRAIAASIGAIAYAASSMQSFAQGALPGQPEFRNLVVKAAQSSPGLPRRQVRANRERHQRDLRVVRGQAGARRMVQIGFSSIGDEVGVPESTFDREPLPDVPSGLMRRCKAHPLRSTRSGSNSTRPCRIAVGGRFAPRSVRVPGLRQI
jgi:hypothetical protein